MVRETLQKIDEVVGHMNTHPEYSTHVRREGSHQLQLEAMKHSLGLEFQCFSEGGKKYRDLLRETAKNLQEGGEYLAQNGLNLTSLNVLGNMVEPLRHPYKSFRRVEVQYGPFTPPTKDHVLYHAKDLIDFLAHTSLHPVTRAVAAHVELVRIHPYEDGNGRVARLVQNFCLEQRGYPSAIIPESEREIYIRLIEGVIKDRNDGKSSPEKPSSTEELFHDIIASKVLASAQRLEEQLRKMRMYEVTLSAGKKVVSEGVVRTVAQKLRGAASNGNGAKVSIPSRDAAKSRSIYVTGDLSRIQLDVLMDRLSEWHRIKYTIKSKDCF